MALPCRKCGATKTEPVRRGTVYKIAWALGYRLRQCSRCRKLRLIRRQDDKSPDSSKLREDTAAVAQIGEEKGAAKTAKENTQPKVAPQVTPADSSRRGMRCCPDCGSTKYHRTKRTALEHLLLRPRMARCELCRSRFPYPKHRDVSSSSAKWGGAVTTLFPPAEEKRAPKMAKENTQPKATPQVTPAVSAPRGSHRCPDCGSTRYHRTNRTILERFLMRPPMARCESCAGRFPYPGPSGSIELGAPVATVPRPSGEKSAPKVAEEIAQPKVAQPVAGADSSHRGSRRCPTCGSTKYHHAKRTTLEHLLLRPRMALCEKCGARFPYPRHHHESREPVKSGVVAASAGQVGEGERPTGMAEEGFQPKVSGQETSVDSSTHEARCCPVCGSTSYRRSGRSLLERILLRPKMARCRNCRKRFPYPKS